MTRIIAGVAGGRRLQTPRGLDTRPTSDRVREALFSALEAWSGLAGVRFLDLYAGTGAVGLEAWSRGASWVTLVESDRRTAALITANARSIGCDLARVVAGPVAATLARGADHGYDIVFADPPYPLPDDDVAGDLAALVSGGWLAEDALVVVERSGRSREPRWPAGLTAQRRRRYGETTLWFATAPTGEAEESR
ncbi:16S rRNA (guanine(966)-N(2))-methyltransferase RsmD [Nocardioides limicola]|uniref:16S rRNA (guanine(966)-N(2))-methyltransferase RsmD n=1 Tax=Nocardioides limicola TaxID=2803368 RepID=UPI00193C2E1C|nr:16S rRNA (guanine(966)-N(2))-methyltransferase RsmD [Nocardioides sp. DJM-14]